MRQSDTFLAFVLVPALFAGACASAGPEAATPAPTSASTPASAPAAAAQPDLPREIHWVRNSAEYRAVFEQTYRLAATVLESKAAGREPGSWAVAIDADETLISNSEQSKTQALGPPRPFEEAWDEWVNRREAPVLPGVRPFLETVRGLGGKIAVVTNRRQHHCDQTADNLRAENVPFDVILCRTDERSKEPRWQRVRSGEAAEDLGPVEILMWLGDNIHDFPELGQELRGDGAEAFDAFGDTFFILPNPLYGSWERNPQD